MFSSSKARWQCAGALLALLVVAAPVVSQIQVRPTRRPEVVPVPGAPPARTAAPAAPTPRPRPTTPATSSSAHPEPVAETKLLMEGIAQPNYQGIQCILRQEPETVEAWTYLRGQSLLVAEVGNLLMLRPPRSDADSTWQEMAVAQRTAATRLARAAGARDYVKSRVALADLTNACNRCHRTFRVATQLDPLPLEKKE